VAAFSGRTEPFNQETAMFDLLPLHPKLVHLPIALGVLMPLLSLGLLLAWWRGALPRRAWVIAVVFQALLVASGVAALKTGEQDEERVEAVVPEAALEAHEEAAGAFVWGSAAVLVLMLAATALRQERSARWLGTAATVGTLVVLFLGYRTGDAGGRLVYQHGAATAYATGAAGGGEGAGSGGNEGTPGGGESGPEVDDHDEDDD
jgi:hypothetical protein